jgi:lysozyme
MIKNALVIDISHWNEVTDWHAIRRSGVLGVVHKFSQGTGYRDDKYDEARAGCKAAGLLFGRYHFAEGSDVFAQVRNFLAGASDDELLALDWEDNTNSAGTMSLAQAVQFVEEVTAQTGQIPALYSGNTAKEALGTPNPTLAQCRLWLAHYADQPKCPPGWTEPWLWQWTDKGSCPGIVGAVDQDAYAGTPDELRDQWTGKKLGGPDARPERPERERFDTISLQVPAGTKVTITTTGDPRDIELG